MSNPVEQTFTCTGGAHYAQEDLQQVLFHELPPLSVTITTVSPQMMWAEAPVTGTDVVWTAPQLLSLSVQWD